MFDTETREAIRAAALENGVSEIGLLTVAEVESEGRATASFNGRMEPLIRFEGHYFDRRLSGNALATAREARLAHPIAGRILNPSSQVERWKMLDRAASIDRKAAFESTSWGLGQVMGAHWAWLGYSNVEALASEVRAGPLGQARLMARFIAKSGLGAALASQDWQAFARGYNGPAFRRNQYDRKLAAAFTRHMAETGGTPATGRTPLSRGSSGQAVVNLQRALSAAGYPLRTDGRFGPATFDALKAFQRDHELAPSGIADDPTLARLARGLPLGARLRALFTRLLDWLSTRQ